MTKKEREIIESISLADTIAYYYSCSIFDGSQNVLITDYNPYKVILNLSKFLKYRNSDDDIVIYGCYNEVYTRIYELSHNSPVPTHPIYKEITISSDLKKVRKITYYFEDIESNEYYKYGIEYANHAWAVERHRYPKPKIKIGAVKYLNHLPMYENCIYITPDGESHRSIEEAICYAKPANPFDKHIEITIANMDADGAYPYIDHKCMEKYLYGMAKHAKIRSVILDKYKTEIMSESYYDENPMFNYSSLWHQFDYDSIYGEKHYFEHDGIKSRSNDYGFRALSESDIDIIPSWIGSYGYFSADEYHKQAVSNYQIYTADEYICKSVDIGNFIDDNLIEEAEKLCDGDLNKLNIYYTKLKFDKWHSGRNGETGGTCFYQDIPVVPGIGQNTKFIAFLADQDKSFEYHPRFSFIYPIDCLKNYGSSVTVVIDENLYKCQDKELIILTKKTN